MSDPVPTDPSHDLHTDAAMASANAETAAPPPADDDALAALEQGLQSSALEDTPDVDIQEYLAAKKRMRQITRSLLQFGAPVLAVGVLLAVMHLNGYSIRHPGRHYTSAPSGAAGDGFSVTSGAPASPTAEAPAVHTKKDPRIAADLNNYVTKQLKSISPDERAALKDFYSVIGQNFRSQTTTFAAVREKVIPEYQKFLDGAEAIHPATPEVAQIHLLFLRSAQVKMLAFKHMVEGENDPTGVWQFGVKAELNAAGQFANQFKVRIKSLAEDQGVTLP